LFRFPPNRRPQKRTIDVLSKSDNCKSYRQSETADVSETAEGTGTSDRQLISRIENGAANQELDTLGKIAAALGVHPHELFEE
jgi:transcriptional regulator with XRE-family HTH domain